MEEVQNEMRENQESKKLLRNARALERQAKRPQLTIYDNEPKPTVSGGEAGLKRVVGAGRRKKAAAAAAEVAAEAEPAEREDDDIADKEGKAFAKHLRKLKGKKFLDAFHRGLMSAADSASDEEGKMEGGRLVPNAVAPVAYGNTPQAPASFERNSVILDREAPTLAGAGGAVLAGGRKKRAPSARGQAIAQLMKTHKMTLAEASKYLKEHSSA